MRVTNYHPYMAETEEATVGSGIEYEEKDEAMEDQGTARAGAT